MRLINLLLLFNEEMRTTSLMVDQAPHIPLKLKEILHIFIHLFTNNNETKK